MKCVFDGAFAAAPGGGLGGCFDGAFDGALDAAFGGGVGGGFGNGCGVVLGVSGALEEMSRKEAAAGSCCNDFESSLAVNLAVRLEEKDREDFSIFTG